LSLYLKFGSLRYVHITTFGGVKFICHVRAHKSIESISCWSLSASWVLLMGWYIMQLSANNLNVECFTTLNRSLMYIKKRMDPSMVPWETSELTGMQEDETPSNITLWKRSLRKSTNQWCILPFIPYQCSLRNYLLWGTVSNALAKSIKTKSVCIPWSLLEASSWKRDSNCVSQDRCWQNLCCRW